MVVKKLNFGDRFKHKVYGQITVCNATKEGTRIIVNVIDSDKFEGYRKYGVGGFQISFPETPEGINLEDCSDYIPYV